MADATTERPTRGQLEDLGRRCREILADAGGPFGNAAVPARHLLWLIGRSGEADALGAERDRLRGIVESLAGCGSRPRDPPAPEERPAGPALDLPTRDQADVRLRHPGAEIRVREGAAKKCRVVCGTEALSGWCATEEAAWKAAAKRVRAQRVFGFAEGEGRG